MIQMISDSLLTSAGTIAYKEGIKSIKKRHLLCAILEIKNIALNRMISYLLHIDMVNSEYQEMLTRAQILDDLWGDSCPIIDRTVEKNGAPLQTGNVGTFPKQTRKAGKYF